MGNQVSIVNGFGSLSVHVDDLRGVHFILRELDVYGSGQDIAIDI